MLFNEPKLLKFDLSDNLKRAVDCFSALQRAEIAEILFSPLDNRASVVSVLFNEPKLLKSLREFAGIDLPAGFSALQRAEIAEMFED